ncbi:MAG: hypothetical protein ACRDRY_18735 [Pseudonocardiaceae bacterium]
MPVRSFGACFVHAGEWKQEKRTASWTVVRQTIAGSFGAALRPAVPSHPADLTPVRPRGGRGQPATQPPAALVEGRRLILD